MRSTPFCPALLAARATCYKQAHDGPNMFVETGTAFADVWEMPGVDCVGSHCAKWVPQVDDRFFGAPPDEGNTGSGAATGLGWCSDNLRAVPWTDPAAE